MFTDAKVMQSFEKDKKNNIILMRHERKNLIGSTINKSITLKVF